VSITPLAPTYAERRALFLAWVSDHDTPDSRGGIWTDLAKLEHGHPGVSDVAQAGQRILRWIDWHARTGLAEWDSIPYLTKDVAALLNPVDFSHDEEVARRAAMMIDLLLFDVAADSFYGQYGTSHGRIAGHHVKSADGDSIVTLQALAWAGFRAHHTGDRGVIGNRDKSGGCHG
jgi:hypothetical protein